MGNVYVSASAVHGLQDHSSHAVHPVSAASIPVLLRLTPVAGHRSGCEVKIGSRSKMARFLDTLDHYLQSQGERLREVFNEFDTDNSGFLDRRELARLIQKLMPDSQARCGVARARARYGTERFLVECSSISLCSLRGVPSACHDVLCGLCRDVEELRTMLDQDGDGQITFEELLGTIKEATEASEAAGRLLDVGMGFSPCAFVVPLGTTSHTLPFRYGSQGWKEHSGQRDAGEDACGSQGQQEGA